MASDISKYQLTQGAKPTPLQVLLMDEEGWASDFTKLNAPQASITEA